MTSTLRHIVCYSGGHASALVAVEVVRAYGKQNVTLLNHDIAADKEHADIKRFKHEVADYLGLPVTFANIHGLTDASVIPDQFDVCVAAKAFKVGNGTELCSNRLKTAPFLAWLETHIPDKDCVLYYGFEAQETARMERRERILGVKGYTVAFPLAQWPRTLLSTQEIGIQPPSTYDTWKHANCVGCLKAGKQHWYVVYCLRPDVWQKAKRAEAAIGYSVHKGETLESLEPQFSAMKAAGVPATEQIPSAKFWSQVKKQLRPTSQISLAVWEVLPT